MAKKTVKQLVSTTHQKQYNSLPKGSNFFVRLFSFVVQETIKLFLKDFEDSGCFVFFGVKAHADRCIIILKLES